MYVSILATTHTCSNKKKKKNKLNFSTEYVAKLVKKLAFFCTVTESDLV